MHWPGTMINAPSHAPAPCTIDLAETAEVIAHGLAQAFQKRGASLIATAITLTAGRAELEGLTNELWAEVGDGVKG